MVPTKCEMNGKLFGGDSYILLSTTMKGSAFSWHLHFWLGDETSQDEAGVAAYKVWSLCGGWCAVTWKGRRDGVQGMNGECGGGKGRGFPSRHGVSCTLLSPLDAFSTVELDDSLLMCLVIGCC